MEWLSWFSDYCWPYQSILGSSALSLCKPSKQACLGRSPVTELCLVYGCLISVSFAYVPCCVRFRFQLWISIYVSFRVGYISEEHSTCNKNLCPMMRRNEQPWIMHDTKIQMFSATNLQMHLSYKWKVSCCCCLQVHQRFQLSASMKYPLSRSTFSLLTFSS
jgi:hypothetical protein